MGSLNGSVITCTCDVTYFYRFSDRLIDTFLKNIKNFDYLHIHIIKSDHSFLKFKDNERVFISYEIVQDIPKINYKEFNILPKNVLLFLTLDCIQSNSRTIHKAVSLLPNIFLLFFIDKYYRRSWLNVYSACRRFMYPYEFTSGVEKLLIIDIDGVFHDEIDISCDFGIMSRDKGWSKYLAGMVYFDFTSHKSRELYKTISTKIEYHFKKRIVFWGLDQYILDSILEKFDIKITKIQFSFNKKSSSYQSFKGNLKNIKYYL